MAVPNRIPPSERSSPKTGAPARPHRILAAAAVALAVAGAAGEVRADAAMEARIAAIVPELETYVEEAMRTFDAPGVAIGIVSGDRLVYGRGFGVRRKGGEPVDTASVFQIGSTTKAFLAATLAVAVDRGKLAWDDRVVDHDPDFRLMDPWVTREFRIVDLLSQRSGLPTYANDMVGFLGADREALIRSLRHVEPVTSFRSTYSYTNITHMIAERIVTRRLEAESWAAAVRDIILEPLGMTDTSFTAEALEAAADGTRGYFWTPDGAVEVPILSSFPYDFGAAGAINSTVDDLARWVRLHLADGTFEGRRIVSAEGLAAVRTARVGINDRLFYAMGWMVHETPNGRVLWHNGGTTSYGAYIGMVREADVGVIVLVNQTHVGLPDAIGRWTLDRLLDNPRVDHAAAAIGAARANAEASAARFARPADPRPAPDLAPLAGTFFSPILGEAAVSVEGGSLVAALDTGARLRLDPWDGDVFTASLVPEGRFADIVANLGPSPLGFAQFQMTLDGALNTLGVSVLDSNQTYAFRRR